MGSLPCSSSKFVDLMEHGRIKADHYRKPHEQRIDTRFRQQDLLLLKASVTEGPVFTASSNISRSVSNFEYDYIGGKKNNSGYISIFIKLTIMPDISGQELCLVAPGIKHVDHRHKRIIVWFFYRVINNIRLLIDFLVFTCIP